MLMKSIIAFSAAILACAGADTITFRDGRTIAGSYLGGDARSVRMVVGEKIQSFSIPDIVRIEFGSVSTTAAAPPAAAPAPAEAASQGLQPSRVRDGVATPAPAGRFGNTEIPAGTQLTVRLIDPVDSETDKMGQTYRASLDEPIVISGETIVGRGADIVAKLVDDKQSGKISGKTVLTLDLMSMTIGGKPVDITTEEVVQSSGSRTGRSAKIIGGAAALGAIIGGIVGGGKGAAVGATAGAGGGTAVQVLTKGEKVKIPSETRLTFILQNPIRL